MNTSFAVEAIRRAVLVVDKGRVEIDRFSDGVAVSTYGASSELHGAFMIRGGKVSGYDPSAMADENVLELLRRDVAESPVNIQFEELGLDLLAAKFDGSLDILMRDASGEPIHGDTIPLDVFRSA
jgi:hypothetical protein